MNFEIVPIEDIPYMAELQPMLLPIMWIENGMDLPKKYTNMLKNQLILYGSYLNIFQLHLFIFHKRDIDFN